MMANSEINKEEEEEEEENPDRVFSIQRTLGKQESDPAIALFLSVSLASCDPFTSPGHHTAVLSVR